MAVKISRNKQFDFDNGLVEYRNARWREFSGFDFDDANPRWRDLIHPDDRPRVVQRWDRSAHTGAPYEIEHRIRRRDGSWRHVLARALPLPGPNGQIVRWFGTLTDITDLIAAREVITREAAQLEALAEQRGRALADSQARLAEAARMEALGRLAGGIAHDFNNVLQAIDGRIDLARRLAEREPDKMIRHLERASEAIVRGAAVTGRLLSFARRGDLQAENLTLAPLLDRTRS